jgi:hypothetical protein
MRILAGTGILGYGFTDESLAAGVTGGLDLVGCDAGSTDPGPYYLGSGEPLCPRAAVKHDLARLAAAARACGAPLVIGTCGGAGTDAQVDEVFAILCEALGEAGARARVARIRSEVDPASLVDAVEGGRVSALDGVPELSAATVRETVRVVGMMGPEPIAAALEQGAKIVLAGRCSDAALFAALPLSRGLDPGSAWYAGKLLECGATCAVPAGPDCLVAELDGDGFTVRPGSAERRCTVDSVTAMSLHENADPFLHRESSGTLDLTDVRYDQADAQSVHVSGARFRPEPRYSVRLEGVRRAGHRTVVVAATRDPRLIARLDDYLADASEALQGKLGAAGIEASEYAIHVRRYGRDGVLGELEQAPPAPTEVTLVAEAVAATRELSRQVASVFRSTFLHRDFPGRQCTEGNFALPFSPAELDGGEAFEFTVWHALALDDPLTPFPIELDDV